MVPSHYSSRLESAWWVGSRFDVVRCPIIGKIFESEVSSFCSDGKQIVETKNMSITGLLSTVVGDDTDTVRAAFAVASDSI